MEHAPPAYKLTPRQEACLKVSKEIAVKYIELGRMGLANFPENFANIYKAVEGVLNTPPESGSEE
jgi:hypothetical protein